MVRPFWFARTEIFRNKRFVLKGTPKFPNGISERKMCLPFAIRNQFQAIRQFSDLHHVRCVNMAAAESTSSVYQCTSCHLITYNLQSLLDHQCGKYEKYKMFILPRCYKTSKYMSESSECMCKACLRLLNMKSILISLIMINLYDSSFNLDVNGQGVKAKS